MKLDFEVIKELDGSFAAACYNERIYTEGSCLQELHDNITSAIESRFDLQDRPDPANVRLIVYKEDPSQ